MINRVVLVGRLTKDIELRKTNNNLSVCRFTVACDRRVASTQPGGQTADFINCIAWRQSADFLAQYASKGAVVAIDGHITTGSYEGANGRVYTTEVTADTVRLIGGNRGSATAPRNENTAMGSNQSFSEPAFNPTSSVDDFSNTPSLDISSDDLPFY